jgi:transaldolase
MSRLKELYKLGQSPWYDNIERGLLLSGKLQKMITDDGIAGVTTNPSIFEKAINGSPDYDGEIEKLSRQGHDVAGIYDELTTRDVGLAADLLWQIYLSSKGLDGYVSIEVSPHLAHDAAATVSEAKRIFGKLARKNVMIKVPATTEGIEAIRNLIAGGINVNATLIFSQANYRQVVNAYIEGLEIRSRRGENITGIASVASFFVSRIDTTIDQLLEAKARQDIQGKAAVSQAKVVYDLYKQTFSSARWQELAGQGAKVQRLLFGSTSTKNPAYSDVKYVEEIIGSETINTLPEVTLAAFRDHGKVRAALGEGLGQAEENLAKIKKEGIDTEEICRQIQEAGVQAFVDAYDKLIFSIEQKKSRVFTN